jgi:hypothetical protein
VLHPGEPRGRERDRHRDVDPDHRTSGTRRRRFAAVLPL